jgi:hypothetical protein
MWDDIGLPDELGENRRDLLESLQLIITLSVMRDIRFHLFPTVIADAKRTLTERRLVNRVRAVDEFAAANSLSEWNDHEYRSVSKVSGLLILPWRERQIALSQVPAGMDRRLVEEALLNDCHVFLTSDKGLLRSARYISPFGLRICMPGDLMEDLFSTGAALCLFDRRFAHWPMPDVQRISHLIQALPPAEAA